MSKVSHAHLPGVLRKPGGKSTRQKTGGKNEKAEKVKRVDCVEAERIMYIVDQFVSRLLLVGGLQAKLVSEVKNYPVSVIELKKSIIATKPSVTKIHNLTRDALRELSFRPDLCAELRKQNFDNRIKQMNEPIRKLRGAMFDRLTMKQSEADDLVFFIRKANQKRGDTEMEISKLKKELKLVENEKIKEHNIRMEKINSLKADIQQVENLCKENCGNIRNVANDQKQKYSENSQQVQNKIVEEIKPTEIEWRKQIIKHRETELVLRGKKFRMQNELDNWLNKYDDFMEQQNGKIADVQGQYDEEKEDMADLQARFAVLKEEYDAIMLERKLIWEEEERKRKEHEAKTFSAQIIQAYFRAYMFIKYDGGKRGKKGKKGKKK